MTIVVAAVLLGLESESLQVHATFGGVCWIHSYPHGCWQLDHVKVNTL